MPKIKIKRDQDELGDASFITFIVSMCDHKEGEAFVSGHYISHKQENRMEKCLIHNPVWDPVEKAFEAAYHYAEEKGISVILIKDPDNLFKDPDNLFKLEQPR
jgi:hypothetical protein